MALMVLVFCCGTDPKTLLESSLKSWEGAQLEKVEGLQPKLQDSKKYFWLKIILGWSDYSCNCIKNGWSLGSEDFDLRVQSGFGPRNSGQAGGAVQSALSEKPCFES